MYSEERFKKLLCLGAWYMKEIRSDHEDKEVGIWKDFQKRSRLSAHYAENNTAFMKLWKEHGGTRIYSGIPYTCKRAKNRVH